MLVGNYKIAFQGTPEMAADKQAIIAYRESTHTILSVTKQTSACSQYIVNSIGEIW